MSTRTVGLIQALVREINARLEALKVADAESIPAVRREFSKRLATASARDLCAVAHGLLGYPTARHRLTAYELVSHHRPALRDWESAICSDWARESTIGLRSTHSRSIWPGPSGAKGRFRSAGKIVGPMNDRWWRRAALVSTVPLNNKTRGGNGDPARTLAICRMLVADRDDLVVKAMSWALRELAKRRGLGRRGISESIRGNCGSTRLA